MPAQIQLPVLANHQIFEDFICDLFNFEFPEKNFQFYGKRGDKQDGIDIISQGKRVAIQCKSKEINRTNTQSLTELKRDFEDCAIKALELKSHIDQLIFVSTFNDSSALIKYLLTIKEKHSIPFDLTYFGWQTIEKKAQIHLPLLKKYYPEIFGFQDISTRFPFFEMNLLEGREDLLDQISQYAFKYSAFALIGVPGIGKTVALSSYLNANREQYNNIVWIEDQLDSLKNNVMTMLSNIFDNTDTNKNIDCKWESLLRQLGNYNYRNLIVLDGIELIDDAALSVIDDLCSTGWKIIITSRVPIPDYPNIIVSGLSADAAKGLFNRYFNKGVDDDSLEAIFLYIEYHPLLIELIAKSIQANQKVTLRQVLELLKDNAIHDKTFKQQIYIGRHAKKHSDKREHQMFKYLMLCLNMHNLSAEQLKHLSYFSVLPQSEAITYDFYLSITDQKSSNKIIKTLNDLDSTGLISKRKGDFYIHPIIQLVIREKLKVKISKLKPIIYTCTRELKGIFEGAVSQLGSYITIARNILNISPIQLDTVFLSQFFAVGMTRMGDYLRAVKYFEQGLEFLIENQVDDINTISSFSNNLANAYGHVGEYDKAIGCFMQSLSFANELDEENAISLGKTLDNFATVLEKIGLYEDAQTFTKEAVKIFEKYKSESNLGIAYISLANSFSFSGQYKKALVYWRKGFKLLKKYFDADSLRLADAYNTQGLILLKINDPFTAKKSFHKALSIYEKEKNEEVASMGYSHIGLCETLINDFINAKIHLDKSFQLYKRSRNGNQQNEANILLNIATYHIHKEEPKDAISLLRYADKIYSDIKLEDHPDAKTVRMLIEKLSSHNASHYCEQTKLKGLMEVLRHSLKLNLKEQRRIIGAFGETRYLKSNKQKDIHFDYVFFCFTKFTKTIHAVLTLVDKGLPEDAMALLYSAYRNYLTIEFLNKEPDLVQIFILYPSYDRMADENNVLNSLAFLDPKTKEERRVYPLLNRLVLNTNYADDIIVHSYLDILEIPLKLTT